MAATIQTIQKPTRARALDTSGNNNHGQIYSGRALEFDGVSDKLNFDYILFGSKDKFTISTWMKAGSTTVDSHILCGKSDEASANTVWIDIPNQDMVYFHRIGRTARAGAKGRAITLFSY